MISSNLIWVFSLSGFALSFLILLVLLLLNSSLRKKEFSPLRNFPYEFLKLNSNVASVFKPLMFVLTGFAFSPIFFITPLIGEFGDLGFLTIFVTCIFGLAAISNCLLFFFDARFTKTHIYLATISMCLTFLANALATLLSFLVFKHYWGFGETRIPALVLAILSTLVSLSILFIIVNPKLSSWAKLEYKVNENGERVYSRGKIFVLALSEWITILASIIGEILFFLSLIK